MLPVLRNVQQMLNSFRFAADNVANLICRGVLGSAQPYCHQLAWNTAPLPAAGGQLLPPAAPALSWDGLLLAVPRSRRSLERRLTRRFGAENWPQGRKLLPKRQLIFCFGCGRDKVAGKICLTCFVKVMRETRAIQKDIDQQLGFEPRSQEVELVYADDDRETVRPDSKKRLVEIERNRPVWFSKNLMEKTTASVPSAIADNSTELA